MATAGKRSSFRMVPLLAPNPPEPHRWAPIPRHRPRAQLPAQFKWLQYGKSGMRSKVLYQHRTFFLYASNVSWCVRELVRYRKNSGQVLLDKSRCTSIISGCTLAEKALLRQLETAQ
jgi:hypothetical protein